MDAVRLWVLYPLGAYLLCSIPFGGIIGRVAAKVDVREMGSGNIGATNVAREVGVGWGLLTLVLDALKGAAPVTCAVAAGAPAGLAEVSGLAGVLGHQFSVFLRFGGGKGVATSLGVFMALEPLACALALAVFLTAFFLSDIVSLGSIAACLSVPVFLGILGGPMERIVAAGAVAALIVAAHRSNIGRILRGEERRWRRDRGGQPRRSRRPSSSSSE
jgi:acyl phosphate:glycerol-3-phosphate acyltransferase